jgi:hypothetical protein
MRSNIPLEVIDIPRPCPADWNAMHGNTQVRFCDHCQLHVYNLSAMTRDAAQQLIAEKEGKLCARLYRRVDGTVITADCGGGWKLRAKKLGRVLAGACAAVLGGMFVTHAWADAAEVRGQVAVQGDVAMPMQGSIAPLPPSTQPTTQPAENPDEQPTMGKVVARPTTQPVEE